MDGDPVFVPSQGNLSDAEVLNFEQDLDSIIATQGGPLHEQPDPLAVRYGSIQPGDKVLILKRASEGDWAYIRLLLTGEEGWFPSEWLRVTRGRRVTGAGRGALALDLDGAYGGAGRSYGLGAGAYFNAWSGQGRSNRFELGGFVQTFGGNSLSYESADTGEVYRLSTRYLLGGLGGRMVGFASGGFLGGALEAGVTYQLTLGSVSGISDEVRREVGIDKALRPRLGMMLGVRGLMSLTSWLQVNTLVRMNLASESNLFWGGAGLSFRIF